MSWSSNSGLDKFQRPLFIVNIVFWGFIGLICAIRLLKAVYDGGSLELAALALLAVSAVNLVAVIRGNFLQKFVSLCWSLGAAVGLIGFAVSIVLVAGVQAPIDQGFISKCLELTVICAIIAKFINDSESA